MNFRNALGLDVLLSTRTSIRVAMVLLSAVGLMTLLVGVQIFRITDNLFLFQSILERSVGQRAQVRKVMTLLRDAEISYSKYLLADSQQDLSRFGAIQTEISQAAQVLEVMFDPDGEQLDRGRKLAEQATAWIAMLDETVDEAVAGQDQNIQDSERLARVPQDIRALADEMIAFEEQNIMRASQVVDSAIHRSRVVSVVTLGGVAVLIVAVLIYGLAYLANRGRVELALRQANRMAEDANSAKTDFLATMSHEIRTPLTGVLGYTELLLGEKLTGRQRALVETIQSAGTNLSVNDILDFSKIEAGLFVPELKAFSLPAMVANVLSIVSVSAERKNIDLRREIDPDLPRRLIGDEPHLRQVLLNLLSNAIKFTHAGHVTFTLKQEKTGSEGVTICIEVKDTGIGFGPEKRDLLFKRFTQLDSSTRREFGGTGLGLAISKELIETMGGEIGAESVRGVGTKFWIRVTLQPADDGDFADDETEFEAHAAQAPSAPGRILLVEDSQQNQELVSAILRSAGHEVEIAGDGVEAIDAVQAGHFDLVLMDVQMPRMDGPAATRAIRDLDHPAARVPVVALTANVLPQQVNAFRKAGMNDFIAKPFKSSELLAKVAAWVRIGTIAGTDAVPALPAGHVHDAQSLADIRSLMGDAWVLKMLGVLSRDLADMFPEGDPADIDESELQKKTHLIVSHSAQLGFLDLSRRCSALEDICMSGGNIAPAFRAAQRAARLAVARIDELLAGDLPSASDG